MQGQQEKCEEERENTISFLSSKLLPFFSSLLTETGQENNGNQEKCPGKKQTPGSTEFQLKTSASIDAMDENCGAEINSMGSPIIFLPGLKRGYQCPACGSI